MNRNSDRLDRSLLAQVKRGFVQMPAEASPGPVAGGGMLTQAQAAPMGPPQDPAAMGGAPMDPAAMDPAAMGGAPMDPAAMGGAPMDPAAMGGGAPVDPSAMSGAPADVGGGVPPEIMDALSQASGAGSAPTSQITMSVPDLIQLIQALQAGGGSKPKAKPAGEAGGAAGGSDAKLDQIIKLLGGNMMGGAAPAPAPQQ